MAPFLINKRGEILRESSDTLFLRLIVASIGGANNSLYFDVCPVMVSCFLHPFYVCYWELHWKKDLSPLPLISVFTYHSVIYLHQCGLMDVSFIQWVHVVTQIVADPAGRVFSQMGSCTFQRTPSFFEDFCTLSLQDIPGSSCIFPIPALGPTVSLRSPGSLYERVVFRNQGHGMKCAHCYWGVITSRPPPGWRGKLICGSHTRTHTRLSLFPYYPFSFMLKTSSH